MNPHVTDLIDSVAHTMAAMDVVDCLVADQVERDSAEEILNQLEIRIGLVRQNLRFRMQPKPKPLDLRMVHAVAQDHEIGG